MSRVSALRAMYVSTFKHDDYRQGSHQIGMA